MRDEGAWPTLPAEAYVEPSVLAKEVERIFRRTWQLACHESDLPRPGSILVFDLMQESALLVRGKDGAVRAFHNVCRHRAFRLLDGQGESPGRIRCRYHGFSYGLDGHLAGVPGEEDFPGLDRPAMGLRPLALERWQGFLFVRFADDAGPSIAEQLAPVAATIAGYAMETMQPLGAESRTLVRCNWKVAVENNIEGYHIPLAHPGLQRLYGDRYRFHLEAAGVSHAGARLPEGGNDLSWSERHYLAALPETPHLPAERQRFWGYLSLFPSLAFDLYPDQIDFFQILPVAPDLAVARSRAYALPDERREMRLARRLNQRINRLVSREDQGLVEGVQRGLASAGYRQGKLSRREARVRQFQNAWRERMARQESREIEA